MVFSNPDLQSEFCKSLGGLFDREVRFSYVASHVNPKEVGSRYHVFGCSASISDFTGDSLRMQQLQQNKAITILAGHQHNQLATDHVIPKGGGTNLAPSGIAIGHVYWWVGVRGVLTTDRFIQLMQFAGDASVILPSRLYRPPATVTPLTEFTLSPSPMTLASDGLSPVHRTQNITPAAPGSVTAAAANSTLYWIELVGPKSAHDVFFDPNQSFKQKLPFVESCLPSVMRWTSKGVSGWIRFLDPEFMDYAKAFERQSISGERLLSASDIGDDWLNTNISNVNHRSIIKREIARQRTAMLQLSKAGEMDVPALGSAFAALAMHRNDSGPRPNRWPGECLWFNRRRVY